MLYFLCACKKQMPCVTGGPWIESPLGPWGPGGPGGPGGPVFPTGPWGPCENNIVHFNPYHLIQLLCNTDKKSFLMMMMSEGCKKNTFWPAGCLGYWFFQYWNVQQEIDLNTRSIHLLLGSASKNNSIHMFALQMGFLQLEFEKRNSCTQPLFWSVCSLLTQQKLLPK